MKGYKHIAIEHAEKFALGESVQIATFSHYRALEFDRADKFEGQFEYKVDKLSPAQEQLPEFADARVAMGLPSLGFNSTAENIIYRDNTVRHILADSYIFSCSSVPDKSRISLNEAIFEICDLDVFAHRLIRARWDLLGNASISKIVYENRSVNPFEGVLRDLSPFKKSCAFAAEKELRIVWHTKSIPNAVIQICAPRVSSLVRRVH